MFDLNQFYFIILNFPSQSKYESQTYFFMKAYLQYWEESERGWGVRSDGCSIHTSLDEHKKFIDQIYSKRDPNQVPDEYDRVVDEPFEVEISDALYNEMMNEGGTLRLMQHSFNNLKNLDEIKIEIEEDDVII